MKQQPVLANFPRHVFATARRKFQAGMRRLRESISDESLSGYSVIFADVWPTAFLKRIDPTRRNRHFGHLPVFWAWLAQILEGNGKRATGRHPLHHRRKLPPSRHRHPRVSRRRAHPATRPDGQRGTPPYARELASPPPRQTTAQSRLTTGTDKRNQKALRTTLTLPSTRPRSPCLPQGPP